LLHPAFRPDLSPRDFWLNPYIKSCLHGRRFETQNVHGDILKDSTNRFSQVWLIYIVIKTPCRCHLLKCARRTHVIYLSQLCALLYMISSNTISNNYKSGDRLNWH
jgi:hypothetical protein